MDFFKIFHSANIILHVVSGTIALLFGIIALTATKGKNRHNKSGLIFLLCLVFVISTGLIGVFLFGRNTFLLVITLLSAYQGFSGYRVLQTKSNQPKTIDVLMALITILSAFYFIYYFNKIGMMWSPVIIYSTVGWLFAIIFYDFMRYLIPKNKYKRTWFYEHIVKMIGSFSAIASAFTGTIFPDYKPYSQFLPSSFGVILMLAFIYYYKKQTPKNNNFIATTTKNK